MQKEFFQNLKKKKIIVGGDHHAQPIAKIIYTHLINKGLQAELIIYDEKHCDYIDQSSAVAKKVSSSPDTYCGIVGCKNGFGVTTVCNKYRNVFAIRCDTPEQAIHAREINYSNILTFGASFVDKEKIKKIVDTWLDTEFELSEKNEGRLKKLFEIEQTQVK